MQIAFILSTVFIKCSPIFFRQKPKKVIDKLENTLYNEFRI
nr:MAG TPA: hypothetical protein [Caudoviricetes sp.]